MKRIAIVVLSLAVLSVGAGVSSAAADDTFADCDSASNYGWNTAWQYVSSSFNRAACDVVVMDRAETALARTLKKQQIPSRNTELAKVCFYEGLYHGYVNALESEYADCGRPFGLLPSVAKAAVTVFVAMQSGIDVVDSYAVDFVFEGAFTAPTEQAEDCALFVLGSEAAGYSDGLEELVESVCWNE
jgi:hypothetical protein